MRKLFLLLISLHFSAGAQNISLEEIRALYQQAASSEEAAETLQRLEEVGEEEPVLLAYKASGTMLMAKYAFSPFRKLSYFKEGKELLQQAVDAAPEKVEIRFLRFALQDSTPGFLGYKDFMEEDKEFLLREIPGLDDEGLRELILPFLLNSEYLTEGEKKRMTGN